MGRVLQLPLIKPRLPSRHQGLRKLSPDLISKAREDTSTQVTRIGVTFLGTAAFCLLSLLSPDSALLSGSERINVPFAGPVSFFGFMLLGPAVLIALRMYLQIYVEHSDRLDRLARSVSVVRVPTLIPLQNSLIRLFSGLIFYALLPVAMVLFAWKAAVFPAWGAGLLCVAVGAIANHAMLPLRMVSWRLKALLSVSAAIFAVALVAAFGSPHRPFDLFRANLSNQWLLSADLGGANLGGANLTGATLAGTNLNLADLSDADLSGANLTSADLNRAKLSLAKLNRAILMLTNLDHADLGGAYLTTANFDSAILTGADLVFARARWARLTSAKLTNASLSYADLRNTELTDADLRGADMSNADLRGADLRGANLDDADLSDANLSDVDLRVTTSALVKGLNTACGNENTKLPEGFTVNACPDQKSRAVDSYHRGLAWFAKGDNDHAIADYNEAIRLDPKFASAYKTRGRLFFYIGDFDKAASDLFRANELTDDAYAMLWRYLARGRLKQDGAPELSANAARLKSKDWPYPVIDFYLGGRTPAEMLGATSKPDEKCEAEFYIGEWQLLRGNTAEATEALQIAADTCPTEFVEYTSALAELKRLKP
jgi:uncharacterized protein YjbI with pentapeptide repeats